MNSPSLNDIRKLAEDWVAARGRFSNAWEAMDDLIREHPQSAFRAIEEIHHLLTSVEPRDMEAWALLAAQPLEKLLCDHGSIVIEQAEALSKQDPEFRKLLCGVWQNTQSDEIFARVQRASNPEFKFGK